MSKSTRAGLFLAASLLWLSATMDASGLLGGLPSLLLVPVPAFRSDITVSTAPNPVCSAVADFDRDGRPDFVVSHAPQNITVLRNVTPSGGSTLSFSAQNSLVSGSHPNWMEVGDINQDGRVDVVIVNSLSNTVGVYLNETVDGGSTLRFSAMHVFPASTTPMTLALGDLNADGRLDVVTGCQDGNVGFYYNTTPPGGTTPTFTRNGFVFGANYLTIILTDLNSDGRVDLVFGDPGNRVYVLINAIPPGTQGLTFGPLMAWSVASRAMRIASEDLNQDGKADLAVTCIDSDTVSVLINRTAPGSGAADFAPAVHFRTAARPQGVALADLDGDDVPEVVVTALGSDVVSVFPNRTSIGSMAPEFAARLDLRTGAGPVHVNPADFNLDGKVDLSVANYFGGSVSFLLNSTIPLDQTPPAVEITDPRDWPFTNRAVIPVTIAVQDESATTVTIPASGDSAALPPGGGTVSLTSGSLTPGSNSIEVVVVDGSGLATHAAVEVIYDPVRPTAAFLSPTSGAAFASSLIPLSLSVADETETWITLAGRDFNLPPGGGVVYAMFAAPSEGPHQIQAIVEDSAGNVSEVWLSVIVDSNVPLVSIQVSPGPFNAGSNPVMVTVTVDDATATTVVSDPPVVGAGLPAGGGVISGVWTLSEGHNTLRITATDVAGGRGTAEVSVLLDTLPPVLTPVFPQGGECLRGTVRVSIALTDAAPGTGVASGTVEAGPLGILALQQGDGGDFSVDLQTGLIPDGSLTLRFAATDRVGNSMTREIGVAIDNTRPDVVLLQPAPSSVVCHEVRVLASVVDAGCGVVQSKVLLDGTVVATFASESSLEALVDTSGISDGPHTITVESVDGAGNVGTASVEVVVDNSVPAVSIQSPAAGSRVQGTVTVSGTVVDANFASVELKIDGVSYGSRTTASPSWSFDTTGVLDGLCRIEMISLDTCGNSARAMVEVTVDNLTFNLSPTTLNLKSKGGDKSVTGVVEGANVGFLLPTEGALLRLTLPNGASVQSTGGFAGDDTVFDQDGDQQLDLTLKFDRAALVAAVKSGIEDGSIISDRPVPIKLVAGPAGKVIGVDQLNLKH